MNCIFNTLKYSFIFVCALIYVTPVVADQVLNSVKTRSGQVVAMKVGKGDYDDAYVVKLNNKIIYKSGVDSCNCDFTGIQSGPFELGDDDVVAIALWPQGSCCYDFSSLLFLSINKNGSVKQPKIYDIKGKLEGDVQTVNCFPGQFSELKLKDNKIIFSCTEMDGRRSKTFKYVYENSSVRVSR